ncbi:hydroxymethylbilane synthase [Paenibacillus sp. y28]|uniref:hydroxymethylbilane synthase n=1 Tax=Paenibacillus sp. y28 TaxID=3129110 RepID=UPI003017A7B9
MRTIVVATRQSQLALTQTGHVVERLKQICREAGWDYTFELKKIVTKGDRILDVTLSKVGGKGLFVKEIEQALIDREADMAVHSMKDMPSERHEGLIIGAVPEREDARDCIITRHGGGVDGLPQGARVGTSSLRRMAQLKLLRPDLDLASVRGNIDSRIRKLEAGEYDAILLAAAGLHRMGWQDRIDAYLSPEQCLPAVGQGALGIECRENDSIMRELLERLHHARTALTTTAERTFLARLNGGCQVPIGAHAVLESNGAVRLTGLVAAPDGSSMLKEMVTGTDPVQLGNDLAEALIARGADRLLAEVEIGG